MCAAEFGMYRVRSPPRTCTLLGETEPACAGQAIVQFAYHSVSKAEFVIKFFLSIAAFHDESNQYTDRNNSLVQFLPKLHAFVENSDGHFQDAFGRSMPPCIVMEWGESLDRWVLRNKRSMDMFTCMQVQLHP
jgi:hypothetical protein